MDGLRPSAALTRDGATRFDVRGRLGAGGMGIVHAAWDRERGMMVALKTLAQMSPEALVRFKNEFRALQDVHHPNLVGLGELINDGDRWLFTMELVEGVDFLSWVRPGGVLAEERLRPALCQLAVGLDAIHAIGRVHRDIKPSNVLVTAEERVVVLDFGLVADPLDPALTCAGTPGYMAPEHMLTSGAVGAWSDWFAVGIVLHEALTGRHPFGGGSGSGVTREVRGPVNRQSIDLDAAALGPLADLGKLCVELLQLDPEARPPGRAVLQRLGARPQRGRQGSIVGRSRELATLADGYARAESGAFVSMMVHGPSGVGKTTLVRHFADVVAAAPRPPLVLFGRCSARESVPFKAIDEAVDTLAQHLRGLPHGERMALLPPDAALLARSFPSFTGLVDAALASDVAASDPRMRRDRMFSALRQLFARLAAQQPLVLVAEDVQWADADSLAVLEAVLEPPRPTSVLLICTLRLAAGESPALPGMMREMEPLALRGLTLADGRELAASLLGRADSDRHAIAEAIAQDAEGLPLFIDILTSWARERGSHARGSSLEDALVARIGALPRAARPLLEAVGLAGRTIPLAVAAAAAGLDGRTLAEQVAILQSANLVRAAGVRLSDPIEIFHDRVRGSLRSCLTREERRGGHRRLAEAFEVIDGANAEALSLHWRKAGVPAKAAHHTVRAADEAIDALAFDRAAVLYRLALRLHSFDEATAQRLRARRADALGLAGRKQVAAKAYREAAAFAGAEDAARLRRRAGEEHVKAGQIDEGLAMLREALSSYGIRWVSSERGTALSIAWQLLRIQLRGVAFRERSESEVSRSLLAELDLCNEMGRYLALVNPALGVIVQLRALRLALRAGEPRRVALALGTLTVFTSALGGRMARRAEQWWSIASELAARVGGPYVNGMVELTGGIVDFHAGRFAQAVKRIAHATQLFLEHGAETVWEVDISHIYRLSAMMRLGDAATMVSEVPRLSQVASRQNNTYGLHLLRHYPGAMAWVFAGDAVEARAGAVAAKTWFQSISRHSPFADWLDIMLLGNIDLYEGKGSAGAERLHASWRKLTRAGMWDFHMVRIDGLDLRARCLLATGKSRQAEKDAAAIRRTGVAWAVPLADLIDGLVACGRADPTHAAQMFVRAEQGFDSQGMRLHAGVARLRRAEVIGAGTADAERALRDLGVADPTRIAGMLAPRVMITG